MRYILLLLTLTKAALSEDAIPVELHIRDGRIRGEESVFMHKRVHSYLGVPFGEAPMAEERFRPPRAKRPWEHVMNTRRLAPACYQQRDTYNASFWGSEMWNANTRLTEDCLYLNIWTPAGAKNLTTMVWIFGGGFYSGSPSLHLYDGRALAATRNVIVLNINYRLGPLGFLYFGNDRAPGNVGLLDQRLALLWINQNIGYFGGNPKSICLFGQDAGAASVVAHMLTTPSLFQRAIIQSGSLDSSLFMSTPIEAKRQSKRFAFRIGCVFEEVDEMIDCLLNKTAAYLMENMWDKALPPTRIPFNIVSRDKLFFQNNDAYALLRNLRHLETSHDLLIGFNRNEGTLWSIYNLPEYFDNTTEPEMTSVEYRNAISKVFPSKSTEFHNRLASTYAAHISPQPSTAWTRAFTDLVGDGLIGCDTLSFASEYARNNRSRVYLYHFGHRISTNPWPKWAGVMHGYELELVFGSALHYGRLPYSKRDGILSNKIMSYWASFAKEGVPRYVGGKSTDGWPLFIGDTESGRWQNIRGGSHGKHERVSMWKQCAVWRQEKDREFEEYGTNPVD